MRICFVLISGNLQNMRSFANQSSFALSNKENLKRGRIWKKTALNFFHLNQVNYISGKTLKIYFYYMRYSCTCKNSYCLSQ